MPSAEFDRRCFKDFILHLEAQIGERVDYSIHC